ncbi:hypothetical protein PMI22_03114, partial [Pseudomonas sp. GM21]
MVAKTAAHSANKLTDKPQSRAGSHILINGNHKFYPRRITLWERACPNADQLSLNADRSSWRSLRSA